MDISNLSNDALLNELKFRLNVHEEYTKLKDEVEELTRKCEKLELLKSGFISNIKNELVNPFTSIISLSQSITQSNALDLEQVVSIVQHIYNDAFNIDFQLKNIFAAAELEAGESILSPSVTDVKTLTQSIIDYHVFDADKKNIKIEFHAGDDDFTFNTDVVKLKLILSNLLSNAIKFSPTNRTVGLRIRKENEKLVIETKNEGDGIDIPRQKEIFDRFQQLTGLEAIHQPGLGLGLAVTKACVDLMSGEISILSKEGKGVICKLTLEPLAQSELSDLSTEGDDFLFDDVELF